MQLSAKLRRYDRGIAHWCPACHEAHVFYVFAPTSGGARWTWDGNVDAPTCAPSMRITTPRFVEEGVVIEATCCHYFLQNGRLQFLSDCTHDLRGQTVDLPDLPPELTDQPGTTTTTG
jgi:hypothetical protein